MLNHHFSKTALAVSLSLVVSAAFAVSLADLSNKDATTGVKAALEKGATVAVSKLGVENGFLNNDCLLYTSPSPRDRQKSRMPSSA